MSFQRSMWVSGAGALLVALTTACSGAGSGTGVGAGPAPTVFHGTYEVPVSPDLASAAVFDVPEVEWTLVGAEATLSYDLPRGLVGKKVRVKLGGATGATSATLDGPVGTAACDVSSAAVVCHESMPGLLPLEPDYGVIAEVAAAEYAGPASDRAAVAKGFVSDPIGIVHVDLSSPVAASEGEVESGG